MKRPLLLVSLASLLLVAGAGLSAADVMIHVAVSPSSIAQCGHGQVFVALGNNGTKPILARVCFALERQGGGTLFGPICGRVFLAAGERRQHEFDFIVPPAVPVGDYALVARATGSDGSSDQSAAPFSVTAGSCVPGTSVQSGEDLLNAGIQSIGATPDTITPTQRSTWGSVKILYR